MILAAVATILALVHTGAPSRNGLVAFDRCCGSTATGIWTVRPNGTGSRRIFRPAADDAALTPAWSPRGVLIAYAPGAPTGGLWVMNANGTLRHRIIRGNGDVLFPTWSTNGAKLAFADLARPGARLHDIWVVGNNGLGLRRLAAASVDENDPVWAPDDSAIAYQRGRDVWVMRTNGTGQRLLIRNASSPSWSPGATHIAFVRNGDPWIVNRNGTGARRVAHVPQPQISVAWSPDGRLLATSPIDRGDILLVAANGSRITPLTNAAGYFNALPAWQRLR